MVVYLLHFDSPISDKHTCQHYIGCTDDLEERLYAHRTGRGARLTQVARERGIGFKLVRVFDGEWAFERKLKQRKAGPRLCPICSGEVYRMPNELKLPLDSEEGIC